SSSATSATSPTPRSWPSAAADCRSSRSTACASGRVTSGTTTPGRLPTPWTSRSTSTGSSRAEEDAMHDHDHDHPHAPPPDAGGPLTYSQRLEIAVRELLIAKGVISGDDVRRTLEEIDSQTPALGAKVVARAWVDPAYRQRLLANGSAAVEEF